MIANCKGCKYELSEAFFQQEEGLHLAVNPFQKGHFALKMVDNNGKLVVW